MGNINDEIVPLMGSEDDDFDQRCYYGYRVDGHAVYCDNRKSGVRKCRRSWYYGHEVAKKDGCSDNDCPFFKKNPNFKEKVSENKDS